MKELSIDYNEKGVLRQLSLAASLYSILFGGYISIREILANNYDFLFYCALILVVISIVIFFCCILWTKKSLLVINSDFFLTHYPKQNKVLVAWENVEEVGIGTGFLILKMMNSKQYEIDLGIIKYNDLKNIKSWVIEICESKKISFHNV